MFSKRLATSAIALLGMSCTASESAPDNGTADTTSPAALPSDIRLDELQLGEALVELDYVAPDTGRTVLIRTTTKDVRILYDGNGLMCPPGWGLRVGVEHPDVPNAFAPHIWFEDSAPGTPELQTGSSAVAVASVDIPAIETAGRVDKPKDAQVEITETDGATASGWYTGRVKVDTDPYIPEFPDGPTFLLRTVAFRGVRTDRGGTGGCRDAAPPSRCQAQVEGRCFKTEAEACKYACGDREPNCNTLDSLPAQVECASQ